MTHSPAKRRSHHRRPGPDAEIHAKVREMKIDRDAEIYKVAALTIVSRKLDEITDLLRSAGFGQSAGGIYQKMAAMGAPGVRPPSVTPVGIQHPCTYCGVESVYRTKPNRYNRTGTWLCRAHLAMRSQHEQAAAAPPQAANAVETEVVVNGGPPLAPEKVDTGVDVGIADAFSALGMMSNAQ